MRRRRFIGLLSVALVVLTVALSVSPGKAQTSAADGSILIESKSIAFGLGFSWGYGRLHYQGRYFPFSVDGVTFGDFGIAKASATGDVYNLSDLAKFDGTYVAVEASFAVGGGLGAMKLRNQDGIVLHLYSVTQGARFQLGSSGLKIKLQ